MLPLCLPCVHPAWSTPTWSPLGLTRYKSMRVVEQSPTRMIDKVATMMHGSMQMWEVGDTKGTSFRITCDREME